MIRKGSKNVALKRDFAHFVVHDSLSINLLNFLQNTYVPDEHFYSTLATVEWANVKVRLLDRQKMLDKLLMQKYPI